MITKTSFRLLYLCIPIAVLFFATMNAENAYPQGVFANESLSSLGAGLLLPPTRTPTPPPTPTPTPSPTPSTVTIEGHIYYEAYNEELATPVTNPPGASTDTSFGRFWHLSWRDLGGGRLFHL